jgi:hypothetical protein
MSRFTTRIELHEVGLQKPTTQDYVRLHEAMKRFGFLRTITGGDGTVYLLPPAEYRRTASSTIEEIRDDAAKAAASVWSKFAVLVTEGKAAWQGLQEVK